MSKLLNDVRNTLRVHHYALKTEKAYVQWIKRFILFQNKTHPLEMGKKEVEEFLTWLAVKRHVSPSTQNQALQAILFLYRRVLRYTRYMQDRHSKLQIRYPGVGRDPVSY